MSSLMCLVFSVPARCAPEIEASTNLAGPEMGIDGLLHASMPDSVLEAEVSLSEGGAPMMPPSTIIMVSENSAAMLRAVLGAMALKSR